MARNRKKDDNTSDFFSLRDSSSILNDKGFRRTTRQLDNTLGQANLTLYGSDRTSDTDKLNKTFNDILKNEINTLTKTDKDDLSSLLGQLVSNDKKTSASEELVYNQFNSINGDDLGGFQSLIQDAYKNRLVKQNDLHEVSSQLIELSEAILITRDAIISADVVEGRMSRSIKFDNIDKDDVENAMPSIEAMEKKFKLLEKIKNFIIPKTLEYGEYYAYIVPYSKIFNDFVKTRDKMGKSLYIQNTQYKESTLLEYVTESEKIEERNSSARITIKGISKPNKNKFIDELYTEYCQLEQRNSNKNIQDIDEKAFKKDISDILGNITVCNDDVPLPILENGIESLDTFNDMYMNESGDKVKDGSLFTEAEKKSREKNLFNQVLDTQNKDSSEGITFATDKENEKKKKKDNFDEITDCYVKLIEPTRMIPVKIMSKVIGYYYVISEDITPLGGMVSSTLYYNKFDEKRKEQTLIDNIAEKIVMSFDKPFLKKNAQFKETITECINYYNLNEKRLRFQFMPVENVQEFKIDEDVEGNGTSMINKSLFYAKLYLMILLFKIMSIILNSNDMKVNYIKQSGIDKNLVNKIEEIARIKQSRQINMYDLFNYSDVLNKVGNGTEMYVPVGRSGERPIETEILSGQDVQLNTELLEMLKNSYILGTGVPAAIVNYMNEVDFAKVVEQNNTKFNGRVVNYQLDFNSSITEFYKKIAKYSTNLPPFVIENLEFELQHPKSANNSVKAEMITQFQTTCDLIVSLYYGENPDQDPDFTTKIRLLKKNLAKDQLPMLNFDEIEEIIDKTEIEFVESKVKPDQQNGDNGDDLGLEEDMANLDNEG